MFHYVVCFIVPDISKNFKAFIFSVIDSKKNYTSKFLTAVQLLDPEAEGAVMI